MPCPSQYEGGDGQEFLRIGAEVLAAYACSQKKSGKTISISLSRLLGAALMNATGRAVSFSVADLCEAVGMDFFGGDDRDFVCLDRGGADGVEQEPAYI